MNSRLDPEPVPEPAGCAEATDAAGGASVVGLAGVLLVAGAALAVGAVVAAAVATEGVEVLLESAPVDPEVLAAGREFVPVLAAAPVTLVDR